MKRVIVIAIALFALAGALASVPLVYFEGGTGILKVQNGGEIEVASGGTLDTIAGATVNLLSRKVVITSYAADPHADSVKIGVSGIDATDPVFVSFNSDRPDSSIYVQSAVARTDTVTVFFNMDPGKAVALTLLSLHD